MPPVMELSKASIKRQTLSVASKMSSQQINKKINELLADWERKHAKGWSDPELELSLVCWSEIWLARKS